MQWLKLPALKVGVRGLEPHSGLQGSNYESCVWGAGSSHSSHHQEVLLAQFSIHVYTGGLKTRSFHLPVHQRCCTKSVFHNCSQVDRTWI